MGKKQVIRLTESDIHNIVKEAVNSILIKEDIYSDQWEDEIRMFFDGLKNGEAIVDDGTYVAVEYGHDKNDPRFIYYKEGDKTLTDDHFSAQHSRYLEDGELMLIKNIVKFDYGIDIKVPQFDEETGLWYEV